MLRGKWVGIAMLAACSGGTKPPDTTVVTGNSPPAGQHPVHIELPLAEQPPWYQPPIPEPETRQGSPLLANGDDLALGARSGLISIHRGGSRLADTYIVDIDSLFAGPVELPSSATFVGIGGENDQVFVVLGDQLKRADNVEAIATTGFKTIAKVPVVNLWATAPGSVAYAEKDAVYVTTDGTGKWTKSVPAKGSVIEYLFARADGVLVAQVKTGKRLETWISKDRKKWKSSRLQPLYSIYQSGAWIRTEAMACSRAVLSADGEHWVERPAVDVKWLGDSVGDSHPDRWGHGPKTFITATTPPAPVFDGTHELIGDVKNNCRGDFASGINIRMFPRIPAEVGLLSFVRDPYQQELASRTTLEVIEDGICRAEDVEPDYKLCKQSGATWLRQPHLALYDYQEQTARVLTAPAGCSPRAARSAVGLGILLCDGTDSTHIYVTTKDGVWIDEGTLPGAGYFGEHEFAADGTIVLRPRCADNAPDCTAWVRSPVPVGAPNAWRAVRGGHVYRAAGSGAVLVVKATTGATGKLELDFAVDHPNQKRDSLITGVVIPSDPYRLVYTGSEIQLTFEDKITQTVFDDGSLRMK
jgi:hypothetical protein